MRIQTARRASRGIGWDRRVDREPVLHSVRLCQVTEAEVCLVGIFGGRVVLEPVHQLVAGWAKVRSARVRRVVACAGGGGSRVKVLGFAEALTEQSRTDDPAVAAFQQTSAGLARK